MVRVRVAAMLLLWAALTWAVAEVGADSPRRAVRGARKGGHWFRHTLFVVPAGRQFTFTGLGVDFTRDRARLLDSMCVRVIVTDTRIQKPLEVRFQRGPHVGQATKMMQRFPGRGAYGPGDTLVVSLFKMNEEYQELEDWPRHVVRWEGYFVGLDDAGKGPKP